MDNFDNSNQALPLGVKDQNVFPGPDIKRAHIDASAEEEKSLSYSSISQISKLSTSKNENFPFGHNAYVIEASTKAYKQEEQSDEIWPPTLIQEDKSSDGTYKDIMRLFEVLTGISDTKQPKQAIALLKANKSALDTCLQELKDPAKKLLVCKQMGYLYLRAFECKEQNEILEKAEEFVPDIQRDETNFEDIRGVHNMRSDALTQLAEYDRNLELFRDSEESLEKAQAILDEEKYPPDSHDRMETILNFAQLAMKRGHLSEARDLFKIVRRSTKAKKRIKSESLCNLYLAQIEYREQMKSAKQFEKAKKYLNKSMKSDALKEDQRRGRALCLLGKILFEEAKQTFESGLRILEKNLPEKDSLAREQCESDHQTMFGYHSDSFTSESEEAYDGIWRCMSEILHRSQIGEVQSPEFVSDSESSRTVQALEQSISPPLTLKPFESLHIFLRARLRLSEEGGQKEAVKQIEDKKELWEAFLNQYKEGQSFATHECQLYLIIAQIYLNAGLKEEARPWLKRAQEGSQKFKGTYGTAQFFVDLYCSLTRAGEQEQSFLNESLALIENFLENNKVDRLKALIAEGEYYLNKKVNAEGEENSKIRFQKAQEYFTRALETEKPRSPKYKFIVYNNLTATYLGMSETLKARESHEEATLLLEKINENDRGVYYNNDAILREGENISEGNEPCNKVIT